MRKVKREFLEDCNVENGSDSYYIEGVSRLCREFHGKYSIAEIRAILNDMEKVEQKIHQELGVINMAKSLGMEWFTRF